MNKTLSLNTDAETQELGARLAKASRPGVVYFLHGPLGAGKTTFVRGFMRGLGYAGKVKSPTYTLVEPYEIEPFEVYHFDLYRLKTPDEIADFDLAEYFNPHAVCLIEWPEKGGKYLPTPDLDCYFDIVKETNIRQICFAALTVKGEQILARL